MGALDRSEIYEGIKAWLESAQNAALYSDKSPCEIIEDLLKDNQEAFQNEGYPWSNV